MLRKDGHRLGYASLGASVVCFSVAFVKQRIEPGVAGAVLIGAGIWLLNRLYMGDPEARREYSQKILALPLAQTLRERHFTLNTVIELVSKEEVRAKFERENDIKDGILPLIHAFGGFDPHLSQLRALGIFTQNDFKTRCTITFSGHQSFSEFYHAIGDNLILKLVALQGFEKADIRRLLQREYAWVADNGAVKPAPPPAPNAPPPGSPHGVMKSVRKYGKFCCTHLEVSKSFWATILKTCPENEKQQFSDLLGNGLFELDDEGFVDRKWAEELLWKQAQAQQLDLWIMERRLEIKRCMERGLCHCHPELERAFAEAIPTTATDSTSARDNIVAFVLEWEFIIRRYPEVIPTKHQSGVYAAMDQWRDAERQYENIVKALKDEKEQKTAEIDKAMKKRVDTAFNGIQATAKRDGRKVPEKPAYTMNDTETAQQTAVDKNYQTQLATADRELIDAKKRIHEIFVQVRQLKDASMYIGKEVKNCLQQ